MVSDGIEIEDSHCPKEVQSFIRETQDFEALQYIDRGINGEVYHCRRVKFQDEVCLKFYPAFGGIDESEEAHILRAIKHDNIIGVHDLRAVGENLAVFVTPWVDGGDIETYSLNNPISSHQALRITEGVLYGVNELHSKHNMVHRDIKPSNVFLDSQCVPLIGDLGAAKLMDDKNGFVNSSRGAHIFQPPESKTDDHYTFKSDLYQVGILLFYLLGGNMPLNSPQEWLNKAERKAWEGMRDKRAQFDFLNYRLDEKIYKGKLFDMSSVPKYLDKAYVRVIRTALNVDVEKRYENASQFLKHVHYLLNNTPDYVQVGDKIEAVKSNVHYRVEESGSNYELFKMINANGKWRKHNQHDGSFDGVLNVIRQ